VNVDQTVDNLITFG